MSKLLTLVFLIILIGSASAAVYMGINPDAKVYFTREMPGPDVLPVHTMIECGSGWSNSCGIGLIDGNILETRIYHENSNASIVNGIVYIEIECAEGLTDGSNGIQDFNTIIFTDPYGDSYSCNNNTDIERLSDTVIRIIPTNDAFPFNSTEVVYSNIVVEFADNAYGNYVLEIYVDEVNAY